MIGLTVNYDHDQSLKKLCAAIYDRGWRRHEDEEERREKERGREREKKSAENLNRPAEGRYVPLHLSSRPVPVLRSYMRSSYSRVACTCWCSCARAYVRSHMSTALVRSRPSRLVQAEGCFSVRGLNVLLLNHNARGRVLSRWNLARGEATRKRKAEGRREGGRVMGEGENSWNYYYSTT